MREEQNGLKQKDSGIEWIGEVPINWNLTKIGSIYSERNTKASDTEYQPLSVTKFGIVPQLETAAKTLNGENRKLILKNDFVINSRSDRRGSCGISKYDGSCSLINTVLIPNININNDYYEFVFKTEMFADEFYRYGHGIVDDLWSTKWTDMKNIYIPMPNIKTQSCIATFLLSKCNYINNLIDNEKLQIEKLKEYKQSLITEVVTKGLDKNVEMKDSGIEWIGKIPKHWEIIKLKFVAKSIIKGKGITKDEVKEDGDIYCVRYGEIYSKYNYSFEKCISKTTEDLIEPKEYFTTGDILCAGTGELLEEIGKNIVYLGKDKCLAGGDIIIVKHNQESRFLNYALNSDYSQTQKSAGKMKLKVVHISATDIGNIILAIPPINEQKKIADYLDEQNCNIDKIKELKLRKINKLSEYKKSLIYEYVTGKREV